MSKTVKVSNKSAGRVVYKVPEKNVRREFYPHEKARDIDVEELEMLAQQPGGRNLIYNYLMVHDEKVLENLINGTPAIEYWLTEDKLPGWMTSCSLDEFKDALDFAPAGTKDLIKDYAFKLPLQDFSKREAIKEQLGYDVTAALENAKKIAEQTEGGTQKVAVEAAAVKPVGRRSTSTTIVKPKAEE